MGHEHHGRFDGCGHCSEELYGLFGLGPHIHEILTDEQLKKVEGRVIYATTEEGKTYPAGIDISDSKYAASIGLGVSLMNDKDRMLLAFPVNSTHIDQIRKFADFFIE